MPTYELYLADKANGESVKLLGFGTLLAIAARLLSLDHPPEGQQVVLAEWVARSPAPGLQTLVSSTNLWDIKQWVDNALKGIPND